MSDRIEPDATVQVEASKQDQQSAGYFVFVRFWPGFMPDFPFYKQFNRLPEDEIGTAIERAIMDWYGEHPKLYEKRMDELKAALQKRARQFTNRVHFQPKKTKPRLIPGPLREWAFAAGWLKDLVYSALSPSRRLFLAQLTSRELATTVVKALTHRCANDDDFRRAVSWTVAHITPSRFYLNPHFGGMDGAKLDDGERLAIIGAIRDMSGLKIIDAETSMYRKLFDEAARIIKLTKSEALDSQGKRVDANEPRAATGVARTIARKRIAELTRRPKDAVNKWFNQVGAPKPIAGTDSGKTHQYDWDVVKPWVSKICGVDIDSAENL